MYQTHDTKRSTSRGSKGFLMHKFNWCCQSLPAGRNASSLFRQTEIILQFKGQVLRLVTAKIRQINQGE